MRVEGCLGRFQRGTEQLWPFLVIPWPMISTQCVVMGNRSTGIDHRLLRDTFDGHVLFWQPRLIAIGKPREVWRWPVRIEVGKAAGNGALAAGNFFDGAVGFGFDMPMKRGKAIPGNGGLHRLAHDSAGDSVLPQMGPAQELVAPACSCCVCSPLFVL